MRKLIVFGIIDFLVGIIVAQLIGETSLIQVDYFKQFKLELYAKQNVDYSLLLWRIVWERAKLFSWFILFSMTRFREYLLYFVGGIFVFLIGFLNSAYVICFGIKGIAIVFGILIPHFLIYGFDVYMIGNKNEFSKVKNGYYYKMKLSYIFITFGLFLLGCLVEALVGTRFLKMILKFLI